MRVPLLASRRDRPRKSGQSEVGKDFLELLRRPWWPVDAARCGRRQEARLRVRGVSHAHKRVLMILQIRAEKSGRVCFDDRPRALGRTNRLLRTGHYRGIADRPTEVFFPRPLDLNDVPLG